MSNQDIAEAKTQKFHDAFERRFKRDELRDLLFRKTQEITDEALKNKGEVSLEQIQSLRRLYLLIRARNRSRPLPIRINWALIAMAAITLIIISALIFGRIGKTEIELELFLSEVSFKIPGDQVLTDLMELSAVGASGLREIRLPLAQGLVDTTLTESDELNLAVELSRISNNEPQSIINLAAFKLPAQTRVTLRSLQTPYRLRMTLAGSNDELRIYAKDSVRIVIPFILNEKRHYARPKAIVLKPDSDGVDLDLTFPDSSKCAFSPQLAATELALYRIDEFVGSGRTLVRQVSTILSGTLYFEDLNGKEHKLRSGEAVRFERSEGEIRALLLEKNRLALKFHGQVWGMSTGTIDNRRSLMPTWLEWLRAQHSLTFLWAATIYLFGLIAGVLHWWRIIR